MSRSRVTFFAILGLGLLVIGSQAVFASSESTHAPIVAATATVHPDQDWNIAGTIQAMNGEFWNVQGFAIRVTSDTRIIGDLPTIGEYVQASGVVQSDGTWLATDLHIGHDSPTATPTSQPSNTSTATPTNTATVTATPSATATPTASLHVILETATPHVRLSPAPPVVQDNDDSRTSDHHVPVGHPHQDHHGQKSDAHDKPNHGAGHQAPGHD